MIAFWFIEFFLWRYLVFYEFIDVLNNFVSFVLKNHFQQTNSLHNFMQTPSLKILGRIFTKKKHFKAKLQKWPLHISFYFSVE
jgi:hypothetical protein